MLDYKIVIIYNFFMRIRIISILIIAAWLAAVSADSAFCQTPVPKAAQAGVVERGLKAPPAVKEKKPPVVIIVPPEEQLKLPKARRSS